MTTRQAGWTAIVAIAGFALAACGAPSASSSSAPAAPPSAAPAQASPAADSAGPQAISINTGDYYFKPNDITLHPGQITVNLFNDGPRRHTFYVRNLDDTDDLFKGDDRLVAGDSETVTFTLPDVGRYKIYCALPGHADRGEVGYLTVAQ